MGRVLVIAASACASVGCTSGVAALADLDRVPECERPTGLGWGDERRNTIIGDVDGDGLDDEVGVLARYRARPGCRFFVVVRSARGRLLAARLSDPLVDASAEAVADTLWPRLSALAEIDRAPGLDLLVTLDQSASGGGVGVFSVRAGRIVRVRVAGAPRRRLFWSLGHNYHASATDCVGRLVVSTAAERSAPDWTWTARRTFFRVDGSWFRRVRATVMRTRSLDRLPEFRPDSLWFRSCPRFRLPRR